jgi:hypothetical protein
MKTIEYEGCPIVLTGDNYEFINLTNCWKAIKSPVAKRPPHWLELPQTKEFIQKLMVKLNVGLSDILQTERGRYGSTVAHWQIAIAYAKYLSPEFHMWVNEVFRDHIKKEGVVTQEPSPIIEISKHSTDYDSYIDIKIKVKLPNNECFGMFSKIIDSLGKNEQKLLTE